MIRKKLFFMCLLGTFGSTAALAATPFYMIRFRGPQTDGGPIWSETVKMLSATKGACDEVWFSTGIGLPPLAWHREQSARLAAAAEDVRRLGIVPSLQFQATLGHGDAISAQEDCSAKTWGGFTGPGGVECRHCSCPRQPAFLAYLREMGRIYGAWHPGSVWIDDDLRIDNHEPGAVYNAKLPWKGCYCATCLAAFNAREKASWTREALVAAFKNDAALYARWERFSFEGLAELAGTVAAAIHEVSPTTHMGYQHCLHRNDLQTLIYKAMYEATGLKVRSRPGGGAYYDDNPQGQIDKAYFLSRQMKRLGMPDYIEQYCPEIETCPRSYSCRTGQGILNEALVSLALGMDSLSLLMIDSHLETPAWYGTNLMARLAANRVCLKDYAAANAGTWPCGLFCDQDALPVRFPFHGIPVLNGPAHACGTLLTMKLAHALPEAELRRIFAGGVVADSLALAALASRGLSALAGGVTAKPLKGPYAEFYTDDAINDGFAARKHTAYGSSQYCLENLPAGARVIGRYCARDGKTEVGVATACVPTPAGGRLAVFGCGDYSQQAMSSSRVLQLNRLADWAVGGLPVLILDPVKGMVMPRTTADGTVKTVLSFNMSIDRQPPVRLAIKGFTGTRAIWHALDAAPVVVPVANGLVTLPSVGPWSGGWLELAQ